MHDLDLDLFIKRLQNEKTLEEKALDSANKEVKLSLATLKSSIFWLKYVFYPFLIPFAIIYYTVYPRKALAAVTNLFRSVLKKFMLKIDKKIDFLTESSWFYENNLVAFYMQDKYEHHVLSYRRSLKALRYLDNKVKKKFFLFKFPKLNKSHLKEILLEVDTADQKFITETDFLTVSKFLYRPYCKIMLYQIFMFCVALPVVTIAAHYVIFLLFPYGDMFSIFVGVATSILFLRRISD